MPCVIADESDIVIGYYTYADDQWAIVQFKKCYAYSSGVPNDETIHGHPLYERGLESYERYEITNSPWIAAYERVNSVHDMYKPDKINSKRHIIFTFHDSIFECICKGYTYEIIDPEKTNPLDRMLEVWKAN